MDRKNSENNGSYMAIGMCLGISIGCAIGTAVGKIGVYMPIGLSIGMCIGSLIDAHNRKKQDNSPRGDDADSLDADGE